MQLSILMPSHRHNLIACSRIAQACSWAGPNIEVIVRDNSGNAKKRELIGQLRGPHCDIISVDECESLENFSELLRLAKGDFVYFVADDDYCFDRAIGALPALLDQFGKDPAVVGVTGAFAVEQNSGSSVTAYADIDADDPAVRVAGYLSYNGPNMLTNSPLRREMFNRMFAFMNTLPFYFSFHDQIQSLIILVSGKFVRLKRLMYLYDTGDWEATETGQQRDLDYYSSIGFDPGINALHWLLCGFEGAALVLNAPLFPHLSRVQLQPIADRWFATMFHRFKVHQRFTYGSLVAGEADKVRESLLSATGQLSFNDILLRICEFIALTSEGHATKYFEFWGGLLNKRAQVRPAAEAVP